MLFRRPVYSLSPEMLQGQLWMIHDNSFDSESYRLEWFQSGEDRNVYFGTRAYDRLVVVCIPSRWFKVRWIVFDAGNGWSWRRITTTRTFHSAIDAAEEYWIQERRGPSSFVPKLSVASLKWLPQCVVWMISKRLHNVWFPRGLSFLTKGETILFKNTIARLENCLSIGLTPDTTSPQKINLPRSATTKYGAQELSPELLNRELAERDRRLFPARVFFNRPLPTSTDAARFLSWAADIPALGCCNARSALRLRRGS
jgi:hypothetical protein